MCPWQPAAERNGLERNEFEWRQGFGVKGAERPFEKNLSLESIQKSTKRPLWRSVFPGVPVGACPHDRHATPMPLIRVS